MQAIKHKTGREKRLPCRFSGQLSQRPGPCPLTHDHICSLFYNLGGGDPQPRCLQTLRNVRLRSQRSPCPSLGARGCYRAAHEHETPGGGSGQPRPCPGLEWNRAESVGAPCDTGTSVHSLVPSTKMPEDPMFSGSGALRKMFPFHPKSSEQASGYREAVPGADADTEGARGFAVEQGGPKPTPCLPPWETRTQCESAVSEQMGMRESGDRHPSRRMESTEWTRGPPGHTVGAPLHSSSARWARPGCTGKCPAHRSAPELASAPL